MDCGTLARISTKQVLLERLSTALAQRGQILASARRRPRTPRASKCISFLPSVLPSELCARPSGDVKTPLCITGNNGAGSAADGARIVINFSLNPERKWWGKCPSSPSSSCARSPLAPPSLLRRCPPVSACRGRPTEGREGGRPMERPFVERLHLDVDRLSRLHPEPE